MERRVFLAGLGVTVAGLVAVRRPPPHKPKPHPHPTTTTTLPTTTTTLPGADDLFHDIYGADP